MLREIRFLLCDSPWFPRSTKDADCGLDTADFTHQILVSHRKIAAAEFRHQAIYNSQVCRLVSKVIEQERRARCRRSFGGRSEAKIDSQFGGTAPHVWSKPTRAETTFSQTPRKGQSLGIGQ